MKKIFKRNVKMLAAFVIGGIVCGGITTVVAYAIASSNVSYNNTSSGSSATNVQEALDDLYTKKSIIKTQECKTGYTKQNENSTSYECRN